MTQLTPYELLRNFAAFVAVEAPTLDGEWLARVAKDTLAAADKADAPGFDDDSDGEDDDGIPF